MLLIDYRQGSKDLIPLLPPELTRQHILESGDAAFFGHGPDGPLTYPIGVEYKTVTETVQVITDKRFVGEQFPKMTRLYKRIYFLLEGEYNEGSDGRLTVPAWVNGKRTWVSHGWSMTFRQFENWQNSLSETGKIVFKRSWNRDQSAAQLLSLYYCWIKDYDQHSSLFAFDKSQLPPLLTQPSPTRLMAAQIPLIGWKRSLACEDVFHSPYELVTAEEEQWQTVKGIGKKMAKMIYSWLRTSKPSNGTPLRSSEAN